MSLDEAQKEARARVHGSTVPKAAIELRHSVFPQPFRLVDYETDLPIPLEANAPVDAGTTQTFIGRGFRFKEPDIGTQPDPTATIEIDGVSGGLQPFLRAATQTDEPIEATVRMFNLDTSDNSITSMLEVYHLQMRGDRSNMTTISGRFGYTNAANQAFPDAYYTPETNPGL